MISLMSFGLGHAGHAALGADHGGHALQRHHGNGAGFFGDAGLLDVHHVHDDAALEHLGEADLEAQRGGRIGGVMTVAAVDLCHGCLLDPLWIAKGCSIPCLRVETWGTQQAEMVPETLF